MNNNFRPKNKDTSSCWDNNFESVDYELENNEMPVLELLSNVLIDNKNEFYNTIDLDDFSFLSFALIKFVKENSNDLSLAFTENNTKGKIILNKELGSRKILLFSKIFEVLTLNSLQFIERGDQWECSVLF